MDVHGSSLREVLRNGLGSRFLVGIAITLILPACADLVGLESSQSESIDPTGSAKPASELPPDQTLPAPRPTNCPGDPANNCGYCGHSCAQTAIVQSPTIRGFTSDGATLWMIADKSPVRCRADAPVTQVCDPIVRSEDVDARMGLLDIDIGNPFPGGGSQQQGGGQGGQGGKGGGGRLLGSTPLNIRAITRDNTHIVMTDDAYHAVLGCPLTGSCTAQNLAIIDARDREDPSDTEEFGPSIASTPNASLSWSQGDALFAAVLEDSKTVRANLTGKKEEAMTDIARILAPAEIFWISRAGLHFASSVVADPQRWSDGPLKDLAVDPNSVYVAGKDGLFRIERLGDHKKTIAAQGAFEHVASDANGLYATKAKPNGGGTGIYEIRQGQQLELTTVPGSIDSLAIVGSQLYFQTRVGNVDEIRRVAR